VSMRVCVRCAVLLAHASLPECVYVCKCMYVSICVCVSEWGVHEYAYVRGVRRALCCSSTRVRLCVCVCVSLCVRVCVQGRACKRKFFCMTVSTENATSSKFNESRNSDFWLSRGTSSNWDFGWTRGGGGALAPQLPRANTVGPNACGEKSRGLSIFGVYLYRSRNLGPTFLSHPHVDLP